MFDSSEIPYQLEKEVSVEYSTVDMARLGQIYCRRLQSYQSVN